MLEVVVHSGREMWMQKVGCSDSGRVKQSRVIGLYFRWK